MLDHDENVPMPVDARSVAPVELWEINEQLLVSILREQALELVGQHTCTRRMPAR